MKIIYQMIIRIIMTRTKRKYKNKRPKTLRYRRMGGDGNDGGEAASGGAPHKNKLKIDPVPENPKVKKEMERGIKNTIQARVSNKHPIQLKTHPHPPAAAGKPFVGLNCSPIVKNKRVLKRSCMPGSVLIRIRDEYNKDHPKDKISTGNTNYKQLWIALYMRLSDCQTESCWLKQIDNATLRQQIQDEIFAPKHPEEWQKNPNEWLSNFDIMKVLKQYERPYKNFKLLGPTTIDFDLRPDAMGGSCVSNELCQISLRDLRKRGKTKIAIVFNLDKHTGNGIHWMSAFVDLDEKFVYYFDSAANPVPEEIKTLIKRLQKQARELTPSPIRLKYYTNVPKNHQRTSTECGMYSLFFIITMLTGEIEFDKSLTLPEKLTLFSKVQIPDKYVEKYREKYFN